MVICGDNNDTFIFDLTVHYKIIWENHIFGKFTKKAVNISIMVSISKHAKHKKEYG